MEPSLIDRRLHIAATRDATCRLLLGRLAGAFIRRTAHHSLGFVRLGDYARERLGVSAGELYEIVRVATALAELPAVAEAYAAGRIGWTKVRLVASVATAEDQRDWLERARTHTAANLRAAVLAAAAEASRGSPDTSGASSDAGAGTTAGASSSARAEAAAQAANSAPAASSDENEIDGEPATAFRMQCPRHVLALWQRAIELARRVAGTQMPIWEAAEAIAAEGLSSVSAAAMSNASADAPGRHAAARGAHGASPAGEARPCTSGQSALHPADEADELPADVLRDLDDATPHALDERMRMVVAAMQSSDAELGRWLRLAADARLHRSYGYARFDDYVREHLGLCARKVRGLVALQRKSTAVAPELWHAYRTGVVSWYRCLLLLPVLTRENVSAWVERAQRVTARRLADEVDCVLAAAAMAPADFDKCPPPLDASPSRLAAHVQRLAVASAGATAQCERGGSVALPVGWQIGEHTAASQATGCASNGADGSAVDCAPATSSAARHVVIRFHGPASVVELFGTVVNAYRRRGEPPSGGLARLLLHVIGCWEALPRHRDPVFERDGWRCGVPACTSRCNLHDHHIVFKSRGGGDDRCNRIAVCAAHHQHAIHGTSIRATGVAPNAVVWELGWRSHGSPLMRLRADVYADASLNRRTGHAAAAA